MKVSDYIIDFLAQQKIDKVFGYIGGNNAHILDSLDKHKNIEMINTIHEQGAGFAAEGYARITGKTGVATTTSGPGATNLITPIADCFFDSVPSIFITGQVNTYECKYASGCIDNAPVRQIGFQEADIVSIVKPITKYAVLIDDIRNLRYEMEKAIYLSQEGRKGPVLIDIPLDLQYQDISPDKEQSFYESKAYKKIKEDTEVLCIDSDVKKMIDFINHSKRPIILVGGGIRISGAKTELNTFLFKTNIPIVYSLMGKDSVAENYTYNLGFIGSYGNRYANMSLANSDLLIVLGSRLDARQTGSQSSTFAREAKVIQVDIDKHEIDRKITTSLHIQSDLKDLLKKLNSQLLKPDIAFWQQTVFSYKEKFSSLYTLDKKEKLPNKTVSLISHYAKPNDIICIDVGLHQMWVAQSFDVKEGQRLLFSGGLGAMGCALPSAIGATLGSNQRSIVIVGDGGFQMNIQELEIIKRRNLPIKIFILNNIGLGMVMQIQTAYLDKHYTGTKIDYSVPEFQAIGNAYGIKSHKVSEANEIKNVIQKSLQNNDAEIVEIELRESEYLIEPALVGNRPMEDMHPFLDRDELEKLMLIKPVDA